jgi:hypothetical protein
MLDRIVEVFCEVDDFCKAFVPQWEASLLGTGGPAPRGPQPGLSTSEIITLVLHSSGFKHLKSFSHGFAEPLAPFPACPAMSTSSPCRKVSSCRWWSFSSAAWGPGSMTSTPPPLRQSSP